MDTIWEVTANTGKKFRIASKGFMIDEALSEFRRVHGYETVICSITYFAKLGEIDGPSTD